MQGNQKLPLADKSVFFEIRFESIGGLGAHLAGQILATAAVLKLGLNGAHFSSYGSEKKGSPIKSYVRLCPAERELRSSSPVERPDLVAVFHEALLRMPSTCAGLKPSGTLILNTGKAWEQLAAYALPAATRVYAVDALGIAVEEKSRVNTAMLGAVARALSFLNPEVLLDAIVEILGGKHPAAVESNRRTFRRGFEEARLVWESQSAGPSSGDCVAGRPVPVYGYLTAPPGGLIVYPGNTVLNDLSASRQGYLPVFDPALCNHCGLCDLVCPDYCLVWGSASEPITRRLEGIDYQYCKGCLRCVDSCPTGALRKEREQDGFAQAHRTPLFPGKTGNRSGG